LIGFTGFDQALNERNQADLAPVDSDAVLEFILARRFGVDALGEVAGFA